MAGTVDLDAVIGGVFRQPRTIGHAGDVGDVADEVLRLRQGLARRLGEETWIARPEADDRDGAAHGRRPSPGTRTIEK